MNKRDTYEPQKGDVIALTCMRPKCIDDLNRPPRNYLLAFVSRGDDEESLNLPQILTSKPLWREEDNEGENDDKDGLEKWRPLYATFLINITTNTRIWTALTGGKNYNIVKAVLNADSNVQDRCKDCSSQDIHVTGQNVLTNLHSLNLNASQNNAVLRSVETSLCNHKSSVELIWGPPGTGKTKTVASLLWILLKMKCRTLTCAPTNIAVVEVASRLHKLVKESNEHDGYGLGDIVLFGNDKRMKIDDRKELLDIFLKYRVDRLAECFVPLTGWRHQLNSMMSLLEDPKPQYLMYLEDLKKKKKEGETGGRVKNTDSKGKKGKWKDQENCSKKKNLVESRKRKQKKSEGLVKSMILNGEGETSDTVLTMWEFTRKRFDCILWNLKYCVRIFCTHLSTSFLSKEVVGQMKKALTLLQSMRTSLNNGNFGNNELEKIFARSNKYQAATRSSTSASLRGSIQECLEVLKVLSKEFSVPNFFCRHMIGEFCLENAHLIFCTATSSAKLNEGKALELLVIDEAAQLKECESTIPLQLPWIRHAILIGDERQLPALVKSEVIFCILHFFSTLVFYSLL
ncbi:hypothetical protein ACHQM5_006826 [Ranunculus cassubicifolius]